MNVHFLRQDRNVRFRVLPFVSGQPPLTPIRTLYNHTTSIIRPELARPLVRSRTTCLLCIYFVNSLSLSLSIPRYYTVLIEHPASDSKCNFVSLVNTLYTLKFEFDFQVRKPCRDSTKEIYVYSAQRWAKDLYLRGGHWFRMDVSLKTRHVLESIGVDWSAHTKICSLTLSLSLSFSLSLSSFTSYNVVVVILWIFRKVIRNVF